LRDAVRAAESDLGLAESYSIENLGYFWGARDKRFFLAF
jgi:hypothetical protein